jgi:hypothetical protein
MAHKLLAEWRIRAVESGYIQEIEPGTLAGLVEDANVSGTQSSEPMYAAIPPVENQAAAFTAGSGV